MPSEEYKRFTQMNAGFRPIERKTKEDYEKFRRMFEEMSASNQPVPPGVQIAGGEINGVDIEWVIPEGATSDKAIVYIHGGGFTIGSVAMRRNVVIALAAATGCKAVSIGYRLAPENPFPAALEDCVNVYHGLLAQGIPAKGIILVGESAGGNLCLTTVLYLKDRQEPLPEAVIAVSPPTDFLATGDSYHANAAVDPLSGQIEKVAAEYASGQDLHNPYISPLYGNLQGFPPVFLQAGGTEVLRDDSRMFAERAKAAGVNVTLRVWTEMGHAFSLELGRFPEADIGFKEITDYIKRQLG